jgi:hypothetical protein
MQRWQGAALAVVLCAGCLDPLVDDDPGYSRWVRPANTPIPSAYDDLQINRKIDLNDGVTVPTGMMTGTVPLKSGFAAGQPIQYWDLGVGKRSASAVYDVVRCGDGAPVDHPLITDTIPGDTDYSPFRSLYLACATAKYNGEIIPSLEAFNDAIDLGLIQDPTGMMPGTWINMPIVAANVAGGLPMGPKPSEAYYRGTRLFYYDMQQQESSFTYNAMPVLTGNVYEIMKPGVTAPAKVIFAQPYWDPADPTKRNPAYSPSWLVVTVTLTATAAADETVIATLKSESDLVTVGMMNALTVKDKTVVASAVVTMNRVNRPFLVSPVVDGVAP